MNLKGSLARHAIGALLSITVAACAAAPAAPNTPAPTPAATPASSHDGHGMPASNAPFDATFIDGMIVHHQGAVAMAQQALKEAQHTELKTMAEAIVKAQQTEIEQMQGWRKSWYPDVKDTGGMAMDMGPMEVGKDTSMPFDIRFIDAMIPHHEGAIAMAKEAQQKSEHAEIKAMAEAIIKTQSAEIEQMKQWRSAWAK